MVNAYTLTFAVLLITGAALGDRFGRKRVFIIGMRDLHRRLGARGALATSTEVLIVARAIQGVGGAIVTPLTLTDPVGRGAAGAPRASRSGAWGGIAGLAIAIGPLVGGAIAEGLDWHWIFWLNVPIGLIVIPLACAPPDRDLRARRPTSTCPASGSSAPACSRSCGASSTATISAGTAPQVVGVARRRRRAPRRLRRLGGSHRRSRCCPMRFFRSARSAPPTPSRC